MFDDKKTKTERTYSVRPPLPEGVLIEVYKRWCISHQSAHIPSEYLPAAKWWMAHQEPAHASTEKNERRTNKDGDSHWITPHNDRLSYTLRLFLKLTEAEKAFVIHGIENGVPWRGDEIGFYKVVCEESLEMAKDKGSYIERAFRKLKSFRLSA